MKAIAGECRSGANPWAQGIMIHGAGDVFREGCIRTR